ncbi:MAG: excinuclease ABC subunit UvrC [Proteobacteria bacterium]|nr:excinuclease ABC subunit UvrC [Pseudomonadota bacterium]
MMENLEKTENPGGLQSALGRVPERTGVYLFRDGKGKVIYVGKAKKLSSRVRNYFTGEDSRPSVRYLRPRIADIEWVVTANETEALILEDNLIKKFKPHYNIRLRDDKSFVSLVLTAGEKFPRFYVGRSRTTPEKGSLIFGPYPSADSARQALKLIRKIFPFRTCKTSQFRNRARPCLNYEIGLCLGPCAGKVGEEEYARIIREVKVILSGKGEELVGKLMREMQEASKGLNYEKAAILRDRIQALEKILIRQRLSSPHLADRDVIGFHREGNLAAVVVFSVRGGKLGKSEPYSFKGVRIGDAELLGSFLSQYYHPPREIPPEIILMIEPEDRAMLEGYLSEKAGGRVRIAVVSRPPRKSLLHLARENARAFSLSILSQGSGKPLKAVQDALHLPSLPRRIEAFDLSHLSGSNAVGAMVTFQDGEPDKDNYRRFRIKEAPGQDDLAMLYEVVTRRFRRLKDEGSDFPDLVLIDGGRGQLQAAEKALADLGVAPPPLAALAKGRTYNNKEEGIYLPGRKNPLRLKARHPALRFLDRIRDEVHRFAITYQRKSRKKAMETELDRLPGIGPARRKALLQHFGSWEKIREATVEELSQVSGLSPKQAEKIYQQIRKA